MVDLNQSKEVIDQQITNLGEMLNIPEEFISTVKGAVLSMKDAHDYINSHKEEHQFLQNTLQNFGATKLMMFKMKFSMFDLLTRDQLSDNYLNEIIDTAIYAFYLGRIYGGEKK